MKKILTAAAASMLVATAAFAGNPVSPAAEPAPYVEPEPASSIGSLGSGGVLLAIAAVGLLVALADDSDSNHTAPSVVN